MNITQRMYFGQFPLDKDRDRRIAFYGRVSTQHEAQVDALGNQMQWYDDQLRYHPNWQVVDRYIDEGITGTSAKKRPAFMKMLSDAKFPACAFLMEKQGVKEPELPRICGCQNFAAAAVLPTAFSTGVN